MRSAAPPSSPTRSPSESPTPSKRSLVLRQQFAGIVMRPGRDDLLKNVNESVARNTANGELNKLYRKWLGVDLPKLQ